MFEQLVSYEPQRSFLIQGTDAVFDAYTAEIIARGCALYAKTLARLTVDDATDMREFIMADTGEPQYCVVYFSAFTGGASEILLKILEEPPIEARIVLITPYPYLVPQTIRSRVRVVASLARTVLASDARGEQVVIDKKNIAEHLAIALGDEKEEATIRRERALFFLDTLEYSFHKDHAKATLIYDAKDLLLKGNLPSKQVLEYIATVVF
jgi:DNA polymerase III delta prime subunit